MVIYRKCCWFWGRFVFVYNWDFYWVCERMVGYVRMGRILWEILLLKINVSIDYGRFLEIFVLINLDLIYIIENLYKFIN